MDLLPSELSADRFLTVVQIFFLDVRPVADVMTIEEISS